jgi:probable rRNA maturation factor
MPDIVDLQRKVKLDKAGLAGFLERLREIEEARGRTFTVALISDRRMKQLNSVFRGKDATTDVLSFPHEPHEFDLPSADSQLPRGFLGDIVISAEQALRQAAENGLTIETEIKQLILHGLLHLCGHDHETDQGEMDARELELRKKLGI